jgi:hypothetical protein
MRDETTRNNTDTRSNLWDLLAHITESAAATEYVISVSYKLVVGLTAGLIAGLVAGLGAGLVAGLTSSVVVASLSAIVAGSASFLLYVRRSDVPYEVRLLRSAIGIEKAARDYVRLKHPNETTVEPTVHSLIPTLVDDGVWLEEDVKRFREILRIRNDYAHGRREQIRARHAEALIEEGRLLRSKLAAAREKVRRTDVPPSNGDPDGQTRG